MGKDPLEEREHSIFEGLKDDLCSYSSEHGMCSFCDVSRH